jgi:hypothetical protein
MNIWTTKALAYLSTVSLTDKVILGCSILSAVASVLAVWLTHRQNVPKFTLLKDTNYDVPVYRAALSSNHTMRISGYGYVGFKGEHFEKSQVVNQYTTFTNGHWGQVFMFDKAPLIEDVYYFYLIDSDGKKHKIYPHGRIPNILRGIKNILESPILHT